MPRHYDRSELAAPRVLGDSLIVEGVVARAHAPGDPLHYADGDEYRDVAEVERIVAQLVGKPVTMPHPPNGMVRDGGAKIIGRVDQAWLVGDRAVARMTITDRAAVASIRSGMKELSLGYETTLDAQRYQRRINTDHVALVERARCGSVCSLRGDSHAGSRSHNAGVTMDPELLKAAQGMHIKTEGRSDRDVALDVLRAAGTDPNGPRAPGRTDSIAAQSDAYVVARAITAAEGTAQRRVEQARSDAYASTPRNDCGCANRDRAPKADEDGEQQARRQMIVDSRDAWKAKAPTNDESGDPEESDYAKAMRDYVKTTGAEYEAAHAGTYQTPGLMPTSEELARAALLREGADAWRTKKPSEV